jgi:hypothetical protein
MATAFRLMKQVDFTCPGLLGKYTAFAKQYEKPIVRAREVGVSKAVIEEGQMRAEEVSRIANPATLPLKPPAQCPVERVCAPPYRQRTRELPSSQM